MKKAILVGLLLLAVAAAAQTNSANRAAIVQKVCQGPEVTSGPGADELRRIISRMAPILQSDPHNIHVFLVQSEVVNAWTAPINQKDSVICIPTVMVRFMGDSEGELAFILAHEAGHAVDDVCKSSVGRAQVASQRSALSQIFGTTPSAQFQQRTCEARADEIGFQIFTRAGYNPYDAAGAFGRLEMYFGDTSTGVIARLAAMGQDHPMTPDRIRHMRQLLIANAVRP